MDAAIFSDGPNLFAMAAALLAAGLFAGFLAGLLGVGGGIVVVPALFQAFTLLDIPMEVRMHLAVGTSLATILATGWRSARAHHRRDAVDMALLRGWWLPILLGVIAGTLLAGGVSGAWLAGVFATVALIVALQMALVRPGFHLGEGLPGQPLKGLFGTVIGMLSTMMGIGGGTLSVPLLSLFKFPIRKAVGTASAIGLIIAVPGTLGFVVAGWGAPDLPPYSVGYVNLVAFAAVTPTTMLAAPWGARVAHAIPQRALRLAFAAFLLATSARLFHGMLS